MTDRHLAPIRFGFGLRLGEPPPADPRGWLLSQIEGAGAPAPGPSSADALRLRAEAVAERRNRDRAEAAAPPADPATAQPPRPAARDAIADFARTEMRGWAERRLATAEPFRERLVDLWTNHFTVSRRNGLVATLPGALEREAIRPHLTGRFADMLVAVTRHPAMLLYLDNHSSVGPSSPAGVRSRRGLNENLAREVLELHSVSPAAGYAQADVTEFAKVLTGWSVALEQEPFGFLWRPQAHEPGEKTLLGQRIPPGPESQETALRMLGTHPATYRHIATRLARHFVADDPPPGAIRPIETALAATGGDLSAAYRALIVMPEAWEPLRKLRTPADYVLAAARASGIERADPVIGGLGALGQPLWSAPQPNGWSDAAEDWAGPEALMRRADWAYTFAGRLGRADVAAVTEAALGPLARAETVAAMRAAGSGRDALTLLFASPEFMRR